MAKKKDTEHQRLLSSARRALAAKHAASAVSAYNAKAARIDAAGKRARRAEHAPPPEQAAKGHFVEVDVNEHSLGYDEDGTPFVSKVRIGRAFQRQPRFETIVGLSVTQVMALRRYRRAFDASELSPVKSGLDIGVGGGSGGVEAALSRIETIALAGVALQRIEAAIPAHHLGILRAIALHDADFKAVALARYGSASGKRRERVKADFFRAIDALPGKAANPAGQVRDLSAMSGPSPAPIVDPAFLDEHGHMRSLNEVAAIVRDRVVGVEEAA